MDLTIASILTLALVTALGPLVYRLAYARLADATVLVLLIVSVGVHFALTGLGLLFFGAEGFRNPSFWDAQFKAGPLILSGQTVIIFFASIALIVLLWLFFERTLRGKALRATAVNRLGARLMGISTAGAGRLSFALAAFIGALTLSGQTVIIFGTSIALIVLLWLFFERTLRGKALRATAVNRTGARLMGISASSAGRLSFAMAAFMGALSGLLIGPSTTVFYDSGFLIGLKGFVAAVFAGLASYPLAAAGALGVGVVEAFGSFWASAFKEVIVFTTILPILLWRSLRDPHHDDE